MLNESDRVFTFKYTSLKFESRPIVKQDNKNVYRCLPLTRTHYGLCCTSCGCMFAIWQIRLHIHNNVHLPSTDANIVTIREVNARLLQK